MFLLNNILFYLILSVVILFFIFRLGRRYCPLGDLLVESGRLGYKSDGKGWFTYVGRERRLTVDPQVTRMIDDYRLRNKITPRAVDGQVDIRYHSVETS